MSLNLAIPTQYMGQEARLGPTYVTVELEQRVGHIFQLNGLVHSKTLRCS